MPASARGASGTVLGLLAGGTYLFLYAPIVVLVALSFNASRLSASWEGFTLEWYLKSATNPAILASLRNSLLVGLSATVLATSAATAAALSFHRHRFRRRGMLEGLITIPTVAPEIVLAASLLLLFAAIGLRLGFLTVILAHVSFTVSYAFVVVKARIAGFDHSLEEAAMDLGAGPVRTFFMVTLPAIFPAVMAAALLVFALSIDDYVVTSFVAGVGATTLPLQIYSMVKTGISPEINAVSTMLLLATGLLLLAAFLLEQGQRARVAAAPALFGLAVLGAPFVLAGVPAPSSERVLNLFIWSGYIAPETIAKFEARTGAKVHLDLYDSNEAVIAKLQAGNAGYDVVCPSDYSVQVLRHQNLLQPLDVSALPHLENLDPSFLDRPFDPGNRYSIPYFWGTTGLAYNRRHVERPDSWDALWDPRYAGRILMLDDAREVFAVALKRRGHSLNATGPRVLEAARDDLIRQKPLVRTYNSTNFEDVLLSGDVWLAHAWSGQIAKSMDEDPDIGYVIPKEGATLFIDNLVIPRDAPHVGLAHAFLDFTLDPEIAAEICRTMRYSSPNRAAWPLLPARVRDNAAIFPPPEAMARLEMLADLGETTVLYDRLWTEVKSE